MLLRNSLTKSHALKRLARATSKMHSSSNQIRMMSTPTNTFPTPILFDYETIKNNLTVADAISSVEEAFGALADGKVDVPMPMHIGIEESAEAGPGDCHIKVSRILSNQRQGTFERENFLAKLYVRSCKHGFPLSFSFVSLTLLLENHFGEIGRLCLRCKNLHREIGLRQFL